MSALRLCLVIRSLGFVESSTQKLEHEFLFFVNRNEPLKFSRASIVHKIGANMRDSILA